jgi:hypothetical protein
VKGPSLVASRTITPTAMMVVVVVVVVVVHTQLPGTVQKPTFGIPSNQHRAANHTVGYPGVFTI